MAEAARATEAVRAARAARARCCGTLSCQRYAEGMQTTSDSVTTHIVSAVRCLEVSIAMMNLFLMSCIAKIIVRPLRHSMHAVCLTAITVGYSADLCQLSFC